MRDADATSKALVFTAFPSTIAFLKRALPTEGFKVKTLEESRAFFFFFFLKGGTSP